MDRSLSFRRSLVARWIPLLGVALPTLAACGGNVVVDQSTANGGGGSSSLSNNGGSAGSNNAGGDGGGGFGGVGGQGGFGGGQGGFGGSSLQCIDPPPNTNPAGPLCPELNDAYPFVNTGECGWIQSGPTVMNGQCCYVVVDQECGVVGRPFLVDGRAQTAGLDAAAPGTGWLGDEGRCPELAALSTPERAALAEAWARDGLMEHASVASFGRFALELLASGAPAALVADAHRAALDEVRHAKLCLSLASAYAGEPIVPGPFDFGRGVAIESDLAALAARTFLEGCVGETLAAVQAVEQLAVATDPAVRAVLLIIAEDEARHAELAWRTVAWALKSGGESVRASLRAALGRVTIGAGEAPASEVMRAHGRLDGATVRASMERALREVVLPCVNGLLGSAPETVGATSVVTAAA